MPELSISRRTRSTPFTSRITEGGVAGYTVYNHMLLPTVFRGVEADYYHLCEHVQVWDVYAERQVQITGPDANKLVQWMTPRDISMAQDDQCFYLPLCDEDGAMINDPIGIKIDHQTWWLSIADSDVMLWAKGLAKGSGLDVRVTEPDVGPIAIQGPKADELMRRIYGDIVDDIKFFRYKRLPFQGHEMIVARSGWSKQGGFEVYIDDAAVGQALWDELFKQGEDLNVGHGCPNLIERIESGLLSFGNDMDYRHTPLQCGLDKYCHLDRDLDSLSIVALNAQKEAGIPRRLVGVIAPEMPTQPKAVFLKIDDETVGEITSSCLSSRYDAWLGFAILETYDIEALSSQEKQLTISTDLGDFNGFYVELPFKFDQLNLKQRKA